MMDLFEVDCRKLDDYLDRKRVEFWNLIVTEGRNAPEKAEGEFESEEQEEEVNEMIDSIM